jgi:predicted AlkP superfamily phosphohydrolase/phosphomutase
VRDPDHPLHEPDTAARVGDPVMDVYAAIDASIGRILDDVDRETFVLVVSCTGMGPNYSGNHVLDEILRRREGRKKTVGLDTWSRLKLRAKRVLPIGVRKRGRRMSRRFEERVAHGDRQLRDCFTVPHKDISGAVRINLVGREPEGRVRPEDVDSFFASLRQDLLEVKNLDTGLPIVEDVALTSQHCAGDRLSDLPDLFVIWRRDAPMDRVGSPKIGEICHLHRGNRTGDHVSESLFFARGPGVPAGEVPPVSILDFAPTLATLSGVAMEESDGKPIEALTRSPSSTR